jgi:hypothetical protein
VSARSVNEAAVAKEEKNPKDAAQSVDSLSMRPLELVKKV